MKAKARIAQAIKYWIGLAADKWASITHFQTTSRLITDNCEVAMSHFVKVTASKLSLAGRKPVCGVGINDAWYMVNKKNNGKLIVCPVYRKWVNMIGRAYNPNYHAKYPTYSDVTVCDEWLTFSVFAKWAELNYVAGYHLDKDIKVKGNKVYSPETCMFIPSCINLIFSDHASSRGAYSVGVCFNKVQGKFQAYVSVDSKTRILGLFVTEEEARQTYVKAKNIEIRRKAKQHPEFSVYLLQHLYKT